MKEDKQNQIVNKMELIITDITNYLNGQNPLGTNQALVGYTNFFRGFIVKIQVKNSDY